MVSINNLLRVDWDENEFKKDASDVEYKGMEGYLQDIVDEYEEESFGETQTDISKYTFWREGRIDILEGYQIYNHLIRSVHITDGGAIVLECTSAEDDEEEEYYFLRVN